MKKFLLSSALAVTFALLAACGDDVTEVTEVNEVHQDGMAVLDAGLELWKQKCDTSNVGDMLFVTDSSEVFVCNGKTWQTLKGADGDPGKPGADGNDGDDGESCTAQSVEKAGLKGIGVTCGEAFIDTLWNGKDGEGCEVSREGNLLTIICAKSKETIELDELIQASSSSAEIGSPSDEGSSSSEEESSSSSVIASSSGAKQSSSSVVASSSSVVFPEGVMSAGYYENHCPAGHTCKDAAPSTYLKAGITYGEILDTRDDQVYKVVTIGTQTWMAQNLNYNYNEGTAKSYCFEGDSDNCDTYGRLYLWSAAMDSAGVFTSDGEGCGYGITCSSSGTIRGVCPEGWHLPTYAEWDTLFTNVGGTSSAGTMLKSTSGWFDGGNGEDNHGFSALPAGLRNYDGYFFSAGDFAGFWSASQLEGGSLAAYFMYLSYYGEDASMGGYDKSGGLSVRCLQNSN